MGQPRRAVDPVSASTSSPASRRRNTPSRPRHVAALTAGVVVAGILTATLPEAVGMVPSTPLPPTTSVSTTTVEPEPEPESLQAQRALLTDTSDELTGRHAERPSREGTRPILDATSAVPWACPLDFDLTNTSGPALPHRIEQRWGVTLSGAEWADDRYHRVTALVAETLDAVDCTPYLDRVKAGNGGTLEFSSARTNSWAWGDYGLTKPGAITLDFEKFQRGYDEGQRGRLVRLIVHEMAHAYNTDRAAEPGYWSRFDGTFREQGPISDYGGTPTESFGDAVGYFVARCAADNPYDDRKHDRYYGLIRDEVFGGREFGGPAGSPQRCPGQGS